MTQINWDSLGFDAYHTRTVIFSQFKDGAWSPLQSTEEFSFTLDPFAQVLHYAISCFEGLKAFRQQDGGAIIFRPDQNAARMKRTAEYLGLPFPGDDVFIKACEECVRGNIEFLPPYGHKASLYLRPILMGIHPQMQLVPYPEALFAVICAPVGSYYGEHLRTFTGVIPGDFDRCAPHGSGSYKLGANYASTFRPYQMAHDQGYTELLFVNSGKREYIDEFGSSNFFGIKDGTYLTPLSDSVLPSITNKSLRTVAEDLGMKVERRPVHIDEMDTFEEAAACGTAVVITPMSRIDMKPVLGAPDISRSFIFRPDGTVGPACNRLYREITGIQFGEIPDRHSWCYKVEGA